MTSLHTRYRPEQFEDVIGQKAVVSSLAKVIEDGTSHCFLFSGPPGCGKTTLARLAAAAVEAEAKDVIEINAASATGVEDMRNLQNVLQYRPFGKGQARAVILDECHMLSKAAWASMLKITEEPPDFLYFFFCTTEPGKVPAALKSRSSAYAVKPVTDRELIALVEWVAGEEKIDLDSEVCTMIVKEAKGSPRQALVNLALCGHMTSKKQAAEALQSVHETDATLELCQFIMSGGSWVKAMAIFTKLENENPESVRIVVCNYLAACAKSSKSDDKALAVLTILEAFSSSYNASEGHAPLLLSIGQAIHIGQE